jgi:acetyl/propionyl-CoA carboxylase alpha subunit
LSKLIGYSTSSNFADAVARTYRALCEFKIAGVPTNIPFLQNLLKHPEFVANRIHTGFVEDHIAELATFDRAAHPRLFFEPSAQRLQAGAKVDETDPLAVLAYGKREGAVQDIKVKPDTALDLQPLELTELESNAAMHARMQGTIVSVDVREGDFVQKSQQVLVMESMKMEHVIKAEAGGKVLRLGVTAGDTVYEGHPLIFIEACDVKETQAKAADQVDLDALRADLAEVHQRHDITRDEARPDVVAKRKERGQRTARENISDLCDPGTFVEYGGLVIAAQRRRRSLEDLIERTPADGLVAGIARVNGHLFDDEKARCAVMAYDYSVLAGTQGKMNHEKKDRMFELSERLRLPLIFFTEGGGGRPGGRSSRRYRCDRCGRA